MLIFMTKRLLYYDHLHIYIKHNNIESKMPVHPCMTLKCDNKHKLIQVGYGENDWEIVKSLCELLYRRYFILCMFYVLYCIKLIM